MSGTVFLEGSELNLRTIEEDDIEFLSEIYNHPEVLPNLTWCKPRNLEQYQEIFGQKVSEDDRIDLLIESEGEKIGTLLLLEKDEGVAEIGIWLHPEHQNQGYGTESCKLLIDYAFHQLRYQKIFVRTYETNEASQKLWEKLDFTQEGTLRKQIYKDGRFENAHIYGLLEEEWRE